MSENTLTGYSTDFKRLLLFLEREPLVKDIDATLIRSFFASMGEVSNKTVLNAHIALSSLWTWMMSEGYVEEHTIRKIQRPKYHPKKVEPFEKLEVRALLAQAHHYRNPIRNRAILLFLLDTGVRASEFCSLKTKDMQDGIVYVRHGKGAKQRIVPISERTSDAIRLYLSKRHHKGPEDALFASERWENGGHLSVSGLRNMIYRLASRSGVNNAHPHRFRHTFAINFLRRGGDIYSLQEILGHSTLEMVKHYLMISKVDIKAAHKRASPVTGWDL